MIYGHGDDNYTSNEEIISNFSSNVWFGADMTELYEYLSKALPTTVSYPEPNADSLVKALSKKLNVAANRLLVTNGSTEAFYLIAQAFRSHNSLIVTPSFSEYEDACRINSHRIYFTSRLDIQDALRRFKPDLMWLCLPNNPDGYFYSKNNIIDWVSKYPKTTFVIDQAYANFTLQRTLAPTAVHQHDNLLLVHSLTKTYKIPGLRLGYMIGSKRLIDKFTSLKMPWSVNTLAIEAGKFILEHDDKNMPTAQWLVDSRNLQNQLCEIEQLEVHASITPFFLVELRQGKAADLKKYLLEKGILVRDATNFRGLEGEYIRLCTQTPEENEILTQHIKAWYSQPN
ncbi:MAG: aminotransferase class I/II-fold pyridoxal phosphate-dependent enzyme [Bacteroidota bacterium]|nr:aminotransferase class I/II-fold pyridoxal phosphate-dependent enzyme [Bacteroidota bacterium]